MKALVYKSTGSWYVVKTTEGKFYNARIKGIFKIDGITSTNPLAVGDEVDMGYQAYSLAETGRDYTGHFLPLRVIDLMEKASEGSRLRHFSDLG